MEVISINAGRRRHLAGRSFEGDTGIFKEPLAGPVRVGELGIDGDVVVDGKHHGGPDQAVYVYRQEDYDWWSSQLGRVLGPGTFGENLTVAGLASPGISIGSRLAFDDVLLEVTAPRIPCNTLATRMGDPAFVRQFVRAERPGAYCRVLTPGVLRTGESFNLVPYAGEPVTTVEMFRAWHRRLDGDEMRSLLAVPIDQRSRRKLEEKLAALEPG